MRCFICGNDRNFAPLFPKFCRVENYLCLNCGLVFIPRKGLGEARFGKNYYKEGGYYKRSINLASRKLLFSKNLFKKLGEERLEKIAEIYSLRKKMKVLDIGCGYGHILYALREKYGCEVLGVEPSEETAKLGSKAFGVKIMTGVFEECSFDRKFDLILCSHTLEHIEDPFVFLSQIKKLLEKKGSLFVEVPNILKPSRYPLETFLYDEHLQTFSSYSLYLLLRRVGFATVGYRDLDFLYFVCRLGEKDVERPKEIKPSEILNFLKDYKASYAFKDLVFVYFKKAVYFLRICFNKLLDFVGV